MTHQILVGLASGRYRFLMFLVDGRYMGVATRVRVLAAVCVGLVGLTLAGVSSPAAAARKRATRTSSFESGVAVLVGNSQRTYNIQKVSGVAKRPLVIVFHGHGGSADQVLDKSPLGRWLEVGRNERLVIAAPQGSAGSDGKAGWNDCRNDSTTNPRSDDTAFTLALIDELVRTANVDPNRVYAVGMSNGGHFVLRLALEHGNRFAGFGAVAAALPAASLCVDTGVAKPMVLINGTDDTFTPFVGGDVGSGRQERGTILSNAETVATFAKRSGAAASNAPVLYPDRDRRDGSTVSRQTFPSASAPVHALTVQGGGHVEPSSSRQVTRFYERIVGQQNHDIESVDVVWALLQGRS